MINTITSAQAPAPPSGLPATSSVPTPAEAKTSRDSSIATVDLKLPDRPHIQYDAEQIRRNLQDAIKRLNEQVQSQQQNLNFRLDETANRFVITVKNTSTGEVIRQIPDDVVLKLAHSIEDLKGMLHNKVI